jgi:hypothetical protein
MSNVAKLKKQAAELELKKQFDKALAIYIKLLDSFDQNASELDVALFNRVGDILLRQGNVADAVDYYEQAVDRYGETGFFNNAIALCNKILRHSPGRASVYYKLGKISAQKGFKNDAKVNFLEYAGRMQKAGNVDEAFRALKEFADLCPDQDEIRLMLADQLTKADRKTEAIEQLQTLHARYDSEGRASEAAATATRMRAIDPAVEPRTSAGGRRKTTSGDLIFLDLDTPPLSGSYARQATPPVAAPPPARHPSPPPTPTADLPLIDTDIVNGTPLSVPSLDEPLGGPLQGDDSFEVVKSTPTSLVFGADITGLEDEQASETSELSDGGDALDTLTPTAPPTIEEDFASLTPMSSDVIEQDEARLTPMSSDAFEETIAFLAPEAPSSPGPQRADAEPLLDVEELEFAVPPDQPVAGEQPSIDFDLSSLVTPANATTPSSLPTPPSQPTPATTRIALDGLPLMDLEIPGDVPGPDAAAAAEREALPLTSELELIVDPALGLTSEGVDDGMAPNDSSLIDLNAERLTIDEDDESVVVPTPSVARRSTMVAAHSVEVLRAAVEEEPENWSLHRQLAEAMLEAGNREGGVSELEAAMNGAEQAGDLDLASSLAEEIARLEPDVVRHHQKRVEYAFRTNDRSRLIEAYVALADTLLESDQADKARTVYQRVLDLAPDDLRARTALDTLSAPDLSAQRSTPPPRSPVQRSAGNALAESNSYAAAPSGGFVNLGDWLRDDAAPKDTRMVVNEQEPSGDEEADFADMLRRFKQGVAENVDPEDYQSHYDLAIAYKEMGLLDEAIAEFQKALGSSTNRLPTYEALGQCFLEKNQYKLATSILSRALNERAPEEQLVGVLYLLGRSAEAQGLVTDAVAYYQRVFVVDIQFQDAADRLNELEQASR